MVQFSRKGDLQDFRGLTFADGRSRNCSVHNTGLTPPLAASKLSDSTVLITRFTCALADFMDDDGTVVDRGPRGDQETW